ncbi:MAG: GFA family protein [Alphaproteobacteria bacterium]|nr:GFA family protein [Alphaproteobacteria bacterium]
MSDLVRTGRCLCRAVRFETRGEPRFISNCHCESCRRAASAPSVTWAGFTDAQVTLTGDTLRSFASSPGVRRFFCGACGSPIAFRGEAWAGETHIPVCAFDAPETMAPASDHFENERLPWAALLGRAHA